MSGGFPTMNTFRAQQVQQAPKGMAGSGGNIPVGFNGAPIQNPQGMRPPGAPPPQMPQAQANAGPMTQNYPRPAIAPGVQMGPSGSQQFIGGMVKGAGIQAPAPQLPPMDGPAFDPNDPNNAALAGYQMTGTPAGMAGSQTKV